MITIIVKEYHDEPIGKHQLTLKIYVYGVLELKAI